MALVVRETMVAGPDAADDRAVVVFALVGATDCVCADARAAAAKKMMARDSFFKRVLDLGERRTDESSQSS
jgi:hypothetical protein